MNQKDPNNVSGLLKMHLRERHLLSDQAVATITANMSSGMVGKAWGVWKGLGHSREGLGSVG